MNVRTLVDRWPTALRLVVGLTAAALLATLVSANVLARPTQKTFSLSPAPPTVIGAGAVSFTISNDPTSQQSLGSLEVQLATAGFSYVNGATASITDDYATATASFLDSTTTPSTSYPTLLVQNLNLPSGGSAAITISSSGISGCGSLQWNFMAQQANQWNGSTSANIVNLNGSQPTSTVLTSCHLSFTSAKGQAAQPSNAGAGQTITTSAFNPSGPPVAVQVQDQNNHPVTGVSVSITLTPNIQYQPADVSGVTLTGGSAATSSSTGTATFPALSINNVGRYTITAAASGISPVTSSSIIIWADASSCAGGTCSTTTTAANQSFSVSTSSSTSGGIGATANLVSFDCSSDAYGGVPPINGTSTVSWDAEGLSSTTKKVEIFIADSLLTASGVNPVQAAQYMVCFSAPYQFPVAWTPASVTNGANGLASRNQTISEDLGGTWYTGVLPDCQNTPAGAATTNAPCVSSRLPGTVNNVAGLIVTISATAGDPMGR